MITKFLRSDGVEFECEVGSESFNHMAKDGKFSRVYKDEEVAAQAAEPAELGSTEPKAKPLAKMNRAELVAEAAKRELTIADALTKAQIIEAIETFDAAEPKTDPKSESGSDS